MPMLHFSLQIAQVLSHPDHRKNPSTKQPQHLAGFLTSLRVIPTLTLYKLSDISCNISCAKHFEITLHSTLQIVLLSVSKEIVPYSDILCAKIWRGRGGEENSDSDEI